MSTTVTKNDLIEHVFQDIGLNKREAKDIVESLFENIRQALETGHPVKLSGFGNLDLIDKKERPGRNPKTSEPIAVSARRVVTFHPGQKLKTMVEEFSETTLHAKSSDTHEE
jgi:integration host factor subunit alpha